MFGLRSARGRAVLAGMVLIVLLAGVATVAIWRTHDDQQRHHALEHTSAAATALEHAQAQFWEAQATLAALILLGDPSLADDYHDTVASLEQNLSQARAQALVAGKADHVATLDDLTERIGQFDEQVNLALPVVLGADPETRVQLASASISGMVSDAEAIIADLEALVEAHESDAAAATAAADRAADTTLWLLIGLSATAFMVAVGTIAILIVSVVRPLASLRASARAITSGDLESRAKVSGPEEVASLARDVNAMTDALAAKTQEYIDTTNLTGDIIARLDKHGRWAFLNDAACQFYGKPREELLGTDSRPYLHPEDIGASVQMVRETRAGKELVRGFVNRQITPMGTRVVEWNGYPLFDEQGQYAGIQATGRDITERQRAEEALRESEERYRDLFENANDLIQSVAPDGSFVYVNRAWREALGYGEDEIAGLSLFDIVHPDSKAYCTEMFQRVMAGEKPDHVEAMFVTKDGRTIWVEGSASCRFEDGKPVATRGIFRDITQRKRAEEALRLQSEITQNMAEAVYLIRASDGVIVYTNPAFERLFGYGPGEMVGKHVSVVNAPTDESPEETAKEIIATLDRTGVWRGEILSIKKDGTLFWSYANVSTFDHPGHGRVWVTYHTDITERKRAEEALRTKDSALESSISAIALADLQGNLTYVNRSFLKIWGYDDDAETLGKPAVEFWRMEEKALEVVEALRDRGSWVGELTATRRDGSTFDVQLSASMVTDDVGKPICMMSSFVDITERKRAEEALRESEERYRSLVETSPDAITLTDLNTNILMVNDQALKLHGYESAEELIGRNALDFIAPEDRRRAIENARRTLETGAVQAIEYTFLRKDGTSFPAELSASLIVDAEGSPKAFTAMVRDITERKRAEQEREKALHDMGERMKELACIYRVTNLSQTVETMEKLLQDAVTVIPPGWHYPEITRAKLSLDGREYVSEPFEETPWQQSSDIVIRGQKRGAVEVYYLEERPELDEGPFLREERNLIDSIARVLSEAAERKRAEEELGSSEERLRILFEFAPDAYYLNDLQGKFVDGNKAAEEITGYTREELIGKNMLELKLLPPEQMAKAAAALARHAQGKHAGPNEFALNRKDGSQVPVEIRAFPVEIKGQTLVLGIARDISERKRAEEELRESEGRYRNLFDSTHDMIQSVAPDGRLVFVNQVWLETLGYTEADLPSLNLFDIIHPESLSHCQELFSRVMAGESPDHVEATFVAKDGRPIVVEGHATPRLVDGEVIATHGFFRDITERKRAEEERERLHTELEVRAITDSLTSLYDHAYFYQRLAEEIDRSKRYNHGFAMVMIDVDDFKRFNDSRGHQAGDEMLRLVADCIRSGLRRSDIAFRYGGDEFAAILPHADPPRAASVVNRINRRITRRLKQPDKGTAVRLSLSAGVACFPNDGTTADDLVRIADAALYSAKWVARARDIMGQREDIQSLVSTLVSRRAEVEGPPGGVIFRPEALHEQQARIVSSVASSIAVALKDAGVAQALEDPDLQVLATVGAAAEIKDRYIRGHPERTSAQAAALAEEMGLSPERVRDIQVAGLLHDIGKVTVSEGILNKPGKLTRREFDSIKDHPIVGATLVSQVKGFERLVPIVRHHHERFDGKGYPDGLAGEEIPLEARILSVVDVFDALTHQRSYRKALNREEAIAELERGAGTQFDPAVVAVFLAELKRRGEGLAAPVKAGSEDRQSATAKAAGRRKG